MGIRLRDQTVFLWHFSRLPGMFSNLILWQFSNTFFDKGQFEKSLNATFISLIPKKAEAVAVEGIFVLSV